MMKKWAVLCITLVLAIVLVACGEMSSKFSPMEVVNAALLEAKEPLAYYGEYTMLIDDEPEDYMMKEWVTKDKKRRVETTSEDGTEEVIGVNDGELFSMHDKATNTVMIMEISE